MTSPIDDSSDRRSGALSTAPAESAPAEDTAAGLSFCYPEVTEAPVGADSPAG